MKPALIVTRGLPGSGKTTWARHWVASGQRRARVNRDDLRENLFGRPAPLPYELEQAVTAAQQEAVRGLLRARHDVVVDDTHLRSKYLRAWEEIAIDEGASFTVAAWFLDTPVETCIARDVARADRGERAVGEQVIREMAERLKNALRSEAKDTSERETYRYTPDTFLPKAWVVDIDGTLARHTTRSPYDYTRVREDEPVEAVVRLVKTLKQAGHKIVVVSGRDGSCREDTHAWLLDHLGSDWTALYMRDAGDRRADDIIKLEIFRNEIAPRYNVLGVLDDRNRVVRMWRSIGLLCCQVAPGAF